MKIDKATLILSAVVFIGAIIFTASLSYQIGTEAEVNTHRHTFGRWSDIEYHVLSYSQHRECTNCNYSEMRIVNN